MFSSSTVKNIKQAGSMQPNSDQKAGIFPIRLALSIKPPPSFVHHLMPLHLHCFESTSADIAKPMAFILPEGADGELRRFFQPSDLPGQSQLSGMAGVMISTRKMAQSHLKDP